MTSQLLEAAARVSGEEEPVAIMAEEQEAAALMAAVMVLHGAAVEEALASTMVPDGLAIRVVMVYVVPYLLATKSPQLLQHQALAQ
jgi:hypothetical protein